jgi:hypothetical protein
MTVSNQLPDYTYFTPGKTLIRETGRGLTNISPSPGENMPPPMQFQQKGPRHTHTPFPSRKGGTDCIIDIPDDEAGYEDD